MLISCICLFLCTSCIYAADVDSESANNLSPAVSDDVIDILPNATLDENPNQDTCNMTDSVIANHNSQYINKTYFSHNSSKHDFDRGSHHNHKIQLNNSDFKINDNSKIKMDNDWTISDHKIHKYDMGGGFTFDDSQAMANNEKTLIGTNIVNVLCLNDTCSFCNVSQCNKVTKKLDFCCCGKVNCHCHDSDDCVDNILGIGNHIDDDFECICDFYTQANVINDAVVRFQNEEENITDVLIFNHTQNSNLRKGVNVTRGYSAHPNIDLCSALANSEYGMLSQCNCNGLDIDSLHSQDLDIKDYNLEYYMFTNPDIIIKRENTALLAKANILIFNNNINYFLKTFDVKTTIHWITLNNSFSTDCKIPESLTVRHIIEDNYASLNIATFLQRTVSLKECEIYYFYNDQAVNLPDDSALILSGDESVDAIIFLLEDLKNV
ncbi:hypothetical protein TL18_06365 [Methanobrevibacter sp. YE315]|uniref:hypothetical protein n=1 Tax=Methanobrevibacter sp. YE315 TaxID=1609968 RepID=UPI000764D2E8|nr:hypothetical protein [Methanobrevibacter sp. YE315]AMD17677.1 hypothetical protein TL18_06365 [Methanobrevibacter sp. YE315]